MSSSRQVGADFEKELVSEYFRYGSIDKVFKMHQFDLPISFAGYHRILDKYGVVKSAGPNSKLSESLYILSLIANYKIPLEKVYRRFAPASIKISANTLHRILHCTRLGLTRRQGVALIIEEISKKGKYLIGNDQSITESALGNRGDYSLPMGHSKTGENPRLSIIRVLQQEVFTNKVLTNDFPVNIVPEHPHPIMYMNIADIKVAVYRLTVPSNQAFSSYKLHNHKFMSASQIPKLNARPGVKEIICGYEQLEFIKKEKTLPELDSNLNTALLAYAKSGSKYT